MSEEKPNMVGRLGLALYWLGCIVAAGCGLTVLIALIMEEGTGLRDFDWYQAGGILAVGAVAWVTGRGLRFILNGD